MSLLRSTHGSPALEFAIIAPVMGILLTGSYDVLQCLIAWRRVATTAQQVVEIATELSVQPDQTMSLTVNQAYQALTSIFALMPGLKSGTDTNKFSVTLSTIVFTALPKGCGASVKCTYTGNTAWSVSLPQGIQVTRHCGAVAQVKPSQPATVNNLQTAGMTALTSIVVADISYIYVPLFADFITGPVTMERTAFLPPRTGTPAQYVQYDLANHGSNKSVCPGYL